MRQELYVYDIYPKVFLKGVEQEITIRWLGAMNGFEAGKEFKVTVYPTENGRPEYYPEWNGSREMLLKVEKNGELRFTHVFPEEMEYMVYVEGTNHKGQQVTVKLSVYALNEDMKGRYPYKGDLHVHTNLSDGGESYDLVCSHYRSYGYDFMTVSDHRRYYPSLLAIEAFSKIPTSFCIVPGEEVHSPMTDVHIVNFGGKFSVNALVEGNANTEKAGDSEEWRSLGEGCPEVMTKEAYEEMIKRMAADKPLDAESESISYAVCRWVFDRIREADGLGIFAHPYWKQRHGYHIPEKLLDVMMTEHPFDAFEVLGGESYYEQNGFQTILYYEQKAKGNDLPIVGSTDTHGSTEHNRNGFICETVVFAKENERKSLIEAIKDKYSIAVDTISREYRLVGDLRLAKYVRFLMDEYYPLHDRLCAIEGHFMKEYMNGDESAAKKIELIKNDLPELQKKYFNL